MQKATLGAILFTVSLCSSCGGNEGMVKTPNNDSAKINAQSSHYIDSSYRAATNSKDSGMGSTNMMDSVARNLKDTPATR